MSATTTPICPLGLTTDDLSAWRDRALASAGERRITAHVATCPACQRSIATHDALAAALRAERPPAPDPDAWPLLQARIASARPAARFAARPWAPRWRRAAVWSGMSAVAAAVIISTLFFSLFGQLAALRNHKSGSAAASAPLSAVAPTTPITGAPLVWRAYAAPGNAAPLPNTLSSSIGFAFAPSDSHIAYACAAQNSAGSNPIVIWASHDGARSWVYVSGLSNTDLIGNCVITVDALNPQRLNLVTLGQNWATFNQVNRSYVSEDGGKTWRALSGGVQFAGLVTRGQTSVAILTPPFTKGSPTTTYPSLRLSISRDNLTTWAPIDGQFAAQGLEVVRVWQRPGDGALLAMVALKQTSATIADSSRFSPFTLWQSVDLGAHWTAFPTPANLNGAPASLNNFPGFLVAQPRGSDAWRVCGLTVTNAGAAQSNELIGCTLDGGKTWTSRPLPLLRALCGLSCAQQETITTDAALLNDGSLINIFSIGKTSGGVIQGNETPEVFRLPPSSSQWQDLGPLPGSAFVTLDTSGAATLVGFSGAALLDASSISGELDRSLGGVPQRGVLSITTLP